MGDFSAHFHRPESGIHTVEGNVAGARAASLTKKRQLQQEEFEQRKQQIVDQNSAKSIHEKFAGDSTLSQAEQTFRTQTIGLVSAEDFKKATQEKEKKQDHNEPSFEENAIIAQELKDEAKKKKKLSKKAKKKKRQAMSTLSFAHEDETLEEEKEEEQVDAPKVVFKDPSTDTSFLPDKQRELELLRQRQSLQQEWTQKQAAVREEKLEIVYSYWDGSGHRRKVICKKGDSIGAFLESVRKDLCTEFKELQSIAADALLYVKEDLILPFDVTFYDLIATKARGKSGPLFHFDVHDDVRVGPIDSRIEKDESHPGKVVERKWYERNKHIFPASRWETYDPTKTYGTYTIHGGEVKGDDKKKI